MTERGTRSVTRSATALSVGPSAMYWDGQGITVDLDEVAVPHLSRIRGKVRLIPSAMTDRELALSTDGAHVWRPFAPFARIEVRLTQPALDWTGEGYLDGNFGSRAIETDFSYWTWSRLATPRGATTIYDVDRRDGTRLNAAFRFDHQGRDETVAPPPPAPLPRTLWWVRRELRADPGTAPLETARWEDAPFYARAAVRTRIGGEAMTGVHETLDLDRFRRRIVKLMMPFRMPRRP